MKNNHTLFLSLFLLCFLTKIQAQIFVNSTASGLNDGTSWVNAYTNLQVALSTATSGDEVWVASGTYYPDEGTGLTNNDRNATFQLKNGVALYGGFIGNETQLSERDWTTNETILSGDINQSGDFTGNTLTVVTGSGTDTTAIIDGFTITRGNENVLLIGAGMINISGSPTIRNNKFINNNGVYGTGLFNQNASPKIINCSFISNQASVRGGGMLNKSSSFPEIINCLFSGNSAGDAGGGMFNEISSVPVIINSTFTGNTANNNGGAILNDNSNPTLTNTIIWNNTASGSIASPSASVFNVNSTPEFSYSLVANSGGSGSWNTLLGTDNGNNFDSNPLFVNPTNGDNSLQLNSPAINAGTPVISGLNLPAEDFSGNPRVSDGTIDMGALEYQKLPITPDASNILYVNQSAVIGNQSGDSWENAALELRDAISWAENTWDGSNAPLQIWVAKGTYLPTGDGTDRNKFFQLVNNVVTYGGFNGSETNLNQRNFTTYETILSGDIDADETLQNNSYTIVNGSVTDATAILDGFTIIGGNSNGSTTITTRGGGIFNDTGSPTITNVKITGNSASFGGGMYNFNNSSPTITNCIILDNQATASGGGLLNINSSPVIINTLFSGNSADNGAGIFNDANSIATISNTTFSENTAVFNGGAIFNGNSNPNLTNIIVWNNTANGITTTASSSVFNSTSSPVISFSLIANSAGSASWDSSIGIDNGNNLDADPLFKDSTNGDFALNDNSPAKNVGTPDVTSLNLPAIDLAGNPRIFGGIIDMGAFENQVTCPSANILYVSASATGNNLGTSWADAYTDLQDALDNNCAGVTEIWVAAGTYKPSKHPANCNGCNSPRDNTFQLKDGISLYGGFNGTETMLSERDITTNETILSGDYNDNDAVTGSGTSLFIANNNENAYHVVLVVFSIDDTTSTTRLDGFTITGGNANVDQNITVNGLNFSKDNGGGVYTLFGNNTIANNKIEVCEADFWGGGIFLNRGINTLTNNTISVNRGNFGGGVYVLFGSNTFSANTISNNTVSLNSGGGMYFNDSNSTLENNTISMNVGGSFGGGISFDEGTYQLINNTIEDNSASIGGGLRFRIGNVTLTNNQINNNEANLGGGIFSGTTFGEDLPDNGTFIFTGNTISGNTSAVRGGGASMNRGSYTFTNNSISNNTAVEGGGGFFISNATTNFNDNTISGNSIDNTSGIAGGGIVLVNGSSTFTNNTVEDNVATNVGGILFQGGTNIITKNRIRGNTATGLGGGFFFSPGINTLTNNSFTNNTATNGGGVYIQGGTNTLTNNSITGNTATTNGGGIYNQNANPTIQNSIIWNNTANGNTAIASASVFNENSTPAFSFNLIANSGGSTSWVSGIGTDSGNNIDANPLFTDAANGDYSLQAGSSAINAGSNAAYQTTTGNNPAGDTDIEGNTRLFQSTIDMGAYEADFNQSQWRGTISEDWANSANWDEGVPDDQSVAIIRDITQNTPKVLASTLAEVSHLFIAENAALHVNGVLKPSQRIDNNGHITFKSDATDTGQFDEFTGNYSGTGRVQTERFIPAGDNNKRAFRFLSSSVNSTESIQANWQEGVNNTGTSFPTDNQNPNPGFGTHITGGASSDGFDQNESGTSSMFTFDNSNQNGNATQDDDWKAIPNTNLKTLKAGEAYLTFIRGDRSIDVTSNSATPTNTTLRARGDLHIGPREFSSANNSSTPEYGLSDQADFYSLVGNPYQAIVDINNLDFANIKSNFYWVWDPNLGSQGQYTTVSLPSGLNTTTSSANQFVQPGQSFFVQTIANGAASLTFNEDDKNTSGGATTIFSDQNEPSIHLLLYTTNALSTGAKESDGTLINFSENANNGLDLFDADKFLGPGENLARLNSNELISIENRAMPTNNETLPLSTTGYTVENYTFVVNASNVQSNFEAYLLDNYTGTQTKLNEGATQINFSVDVNIPASSASDRFSLIFDNTTLGVDENSFGVDFSLYPNPTRDGSFSIKTQGLSGKDVNVKIHNILGQQVMNQKLKVESNGEVNVDGSALSSGVYMVELEHEEVKFMVKLIKE